jgi:enoyl-CoA hydratase
MTALTCFSLTTSNHIAHLVLNKPEAMNTMHPPSGASWTRC